MEKLNNCILVAPDAKICTLSSITLDAVVAGAQPNQNNLKLRQPT